MNQDRLKNLTERADRAVKIAAEIASLEKATPMYRTVSLSYRTWDTNQDYLADGLLKEVVEAGRLAVLAKREGELESLIAVEPEQPTPGLTNRIEVTDGTDH